MLDEDRLTLVMEKIALFIAQGMPPEKVSSTLNIPMVQLLPVLEDEKYKVIEGRARLEEEERKANVCKTWDSVEVSSLAIVSKHLATTSDPDYAAKVATMANKAIRRGKDAAEGLIDAGAPETLTLVLNTTYVKNLQQNINLEIASAESKPMPEKKMINMLAAKEVDILLSDGVRELDGDEDALNALL